jgi:hypothetical protein
MKVHTRKIAADSSGQLLIVTALAIALLISSTVAYIYELNTKTNSKPTQSLSNFVLALKVGTRNAAISSLANISNGGERTILWANLNKLSQLFTSIRNIGFCNLNFTLANDTQYDSGTRILWNTNSGVSSAYVSFVLSVYGMVENVTANYIINITTAIRVSGYFTRTEGDGKLVNLTCKVYNEGDYTLAKNMSVFYENLGSWTLANASNNLSIVDYGNGTYAISFNANIPSETVHVLVKVYDMRDILVQAEAFCNES